MPGTSDTYTIVVSNAGPNDVTGASVSNMLPAGVTAAAWALTASNGGGSVSGPTSGSGALATTVDLPSGSSVIFSFNVEIDPSATGTLVNTATVSPPAGTTDPNPGNNTATDTDTLTPQADLAVTKDDGKTTVVPGTSDTYTITVTNNGPSTVTSLTLTDPMPAALLNTIFGTLSRDLQRGHRGMERAEPGERPEREHDAQRHDRSERDRLAHQHGHGHPAGRDDRHQPRQQQRHRHRHAARPRPTWRSPRPTARPSSCRAPVDTYTITVTNNGPSTVSSLTLTDAIPVALLEPDLRPLARGL